MSSFKHGLCKKMEKKRDLQAWIIAWCTGIFVPQVVHAGSWWLAGADLPLDISTTGKYIDWLFNYITLWNFFYFFLVCVGLFGFSYFYSEKRVTKVDYTHGYRKNQLLVTLAIGAAVFFTIDSFIAPKSSYDLSKHFWNFPSKDDKSIVRVEVLAQQWMWLFRYPGIDEVFNTEDDIVSNHELVLPVNKKVEFRVSSKDVIHSFYLPNARNKVDAMPGRVSRLWFEPTIEGEYDIACAEMCGTHHYLMKARMKILSQDQFAEWQVQATKQAKFDIDLAHRERDWGWSWGE